MNSITKPRILVFASGTKTGGGSGFETMVRAMRSIPPKLEADIVGVVSNHEHGGVRGYADEFTTPFEYWPGPYTAEDYQRFAKKYNADFFMLSGWLKLAAGLDPARTINIHPGPLPRFGGPNMYGHRVHEAVLAAYRRGEITHSAVIMHFVDEVYDRGPIIFVRQVPICSGDTPETLARRVNDEEHKVQSLVLNHVVQWHVRLEGGKVIYATRDLRGMMIPAELKDEYHVVAGARDN
ncbi:MAG: formyltransferase family protein [Candidatus Moranbacteria bacterium]|nr:formyltransferase family protein [Candidatus Moranbacteria bacterium]